MKIASKVICLSLIGLFLITPVVSAEKVIVLMNGQLKAQDLQSLKSLVLEKQKDIINEIKSYKNAGKVKEYKQLWIINAIALDADKDVIEKLKKRSDVAKIIPDYLVSLLDKEYNHKGSRLFRILQETKHIEPSIGEQYVQWNLKWIEADKVWKYDINGSGVKVAVVDTGIYPHEDLAGKIIAWKDFVNNETTPYDDNGHGTHVAGIIAGNETGVAPGVSLIGVKVFNSEGYSNTSTVIEGFQWAAENGADIISYSGGALPMEYFENETYVNASENVTFSIPVKPYINEEAYKPAFIFLGIWSSDMNNTTIKMLKPNGEEARGVKVDWLYGMSGHLYKFYDNGPLQSGNWTLVINNTNPSNNHMWYSGMGNNLNNTLSIELNLTNVTNATLKFDTYYNTEDNFDYGYVEVICNNTTYRLANYTGYSDWHKEVIDLSEFAGKKVTLVFRYETDGSVVYPGWYIDNIEVPEIGFYDNVEKGNIGWDAKGWSIVRESISVNYEALVVYPSDGTSILDNVSNAIVDNGTVVVCAAGNEGELGLRTIDTPASAEKVIAVGATDYMMDYIAQFSSRGPVGWGDNERIKPDVVAPGVNIYSTWNNGYYRYLSGTSMATPHVSGVIALMLQANRSLTPQEVKRILKDTAVDLGKEGEDNTYGAGRISAWSAVTNVTNLTKPTTKPMLFAGTTKSWGNYYLGDTVDIVAVSWNGNPVEGTNVTFRIVNETSMEVLNVTKVTDSLGFANVSFKPEKTGGYYLYITDDHGNEIKQWFYVSTYYPYEEEYHIPYHDYVTIVNGTIDIKFTILTSDLKPYNGNVTLIIEGYGRYLNGTYSNWMEVVDTTLAVVNGTISYKLNLSNMSFDDGVKYWAGDIYLIVNDSWEWVGWINIYDKPYEFFSWPYYVKAKAGDNVTFVVHGFNYVTNKPIDTNYTVYLYWLGEREVKSLEEKGVLEDLIKGNTVKVSNIVRNIVPTNVTILNITATNGFAKFNVTVPNNVYVGLVGIYDKEGHFAGWAGILVDITPWTWHRTTPKENKTYLSVWADWGCEDKSHYTVYIHLYNESEPIPNAEVYLYTGGVAKVVTTDEYGNAEAVFNAPSYNESIPPWDQEFEVLAVYNNTWDYVYVEPPQCDICYPSLTTNLNDGVLNIFIKHLDENGEPKVCPSVFDVNTVSSTLHSEYLNTSYAERTFEVSYGKYTVRDIMFNKWSTFYALKYVSYTPLMVLTPLQHYYPANKEIDIDVHVKNGSNALVYLFASSEYYYEEEMPTSSYSYLYTTRADDNGNATLKLVTPSNESFVWFKIGVIKADYSDPSAYSDYIYTLKELKPDLTVKLSVPKLKAGEEGVIKAYVYNIGTTTSNATTLNLYIDGNLVKTFNVSSLNASEFKVFNYTWTASEGLHVIKAVVDPDNLNDELSESNNVSVVKIEVLKYYNVSGEIYYNGSLSGKIYVTAITANAAVDTISQPAGYVAYAVLNNPGMYTLSLPNGSYYIFAFMDVNSNNAYDAGEPFGFAINKSDFNNADVINVNGSDVSGVDVTLVSLQSMVMVGSVIGSGNIKAPIYLANVYDVTGLNFTLTFDPNAVKAISVDRGWYNINNTTGYVKVAVVFENPLTTVKPIPVVNITFNVSGDTYLNLTNVVLSNESFKPFKPDIIINGSIKAGVPGDFNGNGRVDIGDIVYVAYMVLGKVPVDKKVDFNNNGVVDIGDLAKIVYYFMGKIDKLYS